MIIFWDYIPSEGGPVVVLDGGWGWGRRGRGDKEDFQLITSK
jgi:hypothetical protein